MPSFLNTDTDKKCLITLRPELLNPKVFREGRFEFQLHTKLKDLVNFFLDNGAGETEFGNSVKHHSARLMGCFKYSDFVSHYGQVVGAGDSGGASTDHCHLLPASYILA